MLDSPDTILLNNVARNADCRDVYRDSYVAGQTEWAIYA